MAGLTLVEASKLQQDMLKAAIIEMYARAIPLFTYLEFMDIPGNAYRYNREESLPGVGFRGVNENWDDSVGVLNPQTETLVIAGGELKVDNFIVATNPAARATHEYLKIKAASRFFYKKFFKGDSASDPREFDGLQVRLTGNQLIPAGATDGGDPLSLFILDELIHAVDEPDALWMNQKMIRRLTQASRNSSVGGFITFDQDDFGREVTRYNKLPIYPVDYDNTGAQILPFTEVGPGGATPTCTSIYCTSKEDGHLQGIQNGEMDVRDMGEMQSEPKHLTRVEWYPGIALEHGKSAARLWGIKDAAITA